jgi:type I restriction enzyme R subunit
LGRASELEVVLVRDLSAALERLNPQVPQSAREQAVEKLTRVDLSRSLVQHNREFYHYIRLGVPVEWRDDNGEIQRVRAQVIDFRNAANNRFLAVRELKVQGCACRITTGGLILSASSTVYLWSSSSSKLFI